MSYIDVRGPDGRKLFRFDPVRLLVEIVRRDVVYVIDLTNLLEASPRETKPARGAIQVWDASPPP